MCALRAVGAVPLLALPVFCVLRGILVHALPPNGVIVEVADNIGKDGVLFGGGKGVGVRLFARAGGYAEEAVFRVYRPQSAVRAYAQPCDIIADSPALPALFTVNLGWDEHCEIGLAAGRRECAADIADLTLRVLNAEDEHMLCHPVLITAESGGYAQGKALFR